MTAAPIRLHTGGMATTTVTRTTISRDPELVALVEAEPDYPGASAMLDTADRAWLRAKGIAVGDRPAPVPLHEAARLARIERKTKAPAKKIAKPKSRP